jgi:hypothetical protein
MDWMELEKIEKKFDLLGIQTHPIPLNPHGLRANRTSPYMFLFVTTSILVAKKTPPTWLGIGKMNWARASYCQKKTPPTWLGIGKDKLVVQAKPRAFHISTGKKKKILEPDACQLPRRATS